MGATDRSVLHLAALVKDNQHNGVHVLGAAHHLCAAVKLGGRHS